MYEQVGWLAGQSGLIVHEIRKCCEPVQVIRKRRLPREPAFSRVGSSAVLDYLMTGLLRQVTEQERLPVGPSSQCSPSPLCTIPSPQKGALVQSSLHEPYSPSLLTVPRSHCSGPLRSPSPQ